jgi:hypothetical protein
MRMHRRRERPGDRMSHWKLNTGLAARPLTIALFAGLIGLAGLMLLRPQAVHDLQYTMIDNIEPQEFKSLPPSGAVKLLPRDAIPAILKPEKVEAAKADLRPDDRVIGVALEGQAVAYSIGILDQHEIVNDTIAKLPIATTW